MSTVIAESAKLRLGLAAAGTPLSPEEFDTADCDPHYRYELINGVLVVTPAPLLNERDPNEELGYWLRDYRDRHPNGESLDLTVPEHDVLIGEDRRRADRAIWAGFGKLPQPDETPTIVAEFVSAGKRNLLRDYEHKRTEYETIGVREYWVFNRFDCTLTVFRPDGDRQVFGIEQTYTTPLLPGFELPLKRLFEFANRWA